MSEIGFRAKPTEELSSYARNDKSKLGTSNVISRHQFDDISSGFPRPFHHAAITQSMTQNIGRAGEVHGSNRTCFLSRGRVAGL